MLTPYTFFSHEKIIMSEWYVSPSLEHLYSWYSLAEDLQKSITQSRTLCAYPLTTAS